MMILDGNIVSKKELLEVNNALLKIEKELKVVVIVNDSNVDTSLIDNLASKANIKFTIANFENDINKYDEMIDILNNDVDVTGIIPLIQNNILFNIDEMINKIDYKKDVLGITDMSTIKFNTSKQVSTYFHAASIITLIKSYNINIDNLNVALLSTKNSTNTLLLNYFSKHKCNVVVYSNPNDYYEETINKSDLIINNSSRFGVIKEENIKNGVILIDAYYSTDKNKLLGYIDFINCKNRAEFITTIPNGFNLLNNSMILKNVIKCAESQNII